MAEKYLARFLGNLRDYGPAPICEKCGCTDNISRIMNYDTCSGCRKYVDSRLE